MPPIPEELAAALPHMMPAPPDMTVPPKPAPRELLLYPGGPTLHLPAEWPEDRAQAAMDYLRGRLLGAPPPPVAPLAAAPGYPSRFGLALPDGD